MLSYSVDGHILTVHVTGASDPEQRGALLQAIRNDPAVPRGAVLLLRVEDITETFDDAELRARLAGLIRGLGPKLVPVCAVIGPQSYLLEGHRFQNLAGQAGLRVGLFRDEASARTWLSGYVPEDPPEGE